MKEYIMSLEKEFSLIENGFKEEEKKSLLPITNLMIMSIVKMAFLAYKSNVYIKLECNGVFLLDTYQNKMIFSIYAER